MFTQQAAIDKVQHFAQAVQANGLNLTKVILFGSYAHNRQHEWSDIDVVLVADEFTGFGFEDRKYFASVNIQKDYLNIETRTFPTAYFAQGDPFIDEIKKTGIEIKISHTKV